MFDNENDADFNHFTGKEMLEYFQECWSEQNKLSVKNAQFADSVRGELEKIDENIVRLHRSFHTFANDSNEIMSLDRALNDVENEITKSFRLCCALEDALTDLDKEFESLDFRMRERESEKRLEEITQRREDDLVVLKAQFETIIAQKRKDKENREAEISRERQRVFQEAFEEEVARYKSGTLPTKNKRNCDILNTVSGQQDLHSQLLNIDVADDEEVAALESFLAS